MKRDNNLIEKTSNGEAVLGGSVATFSPSVIETLGAIGMDFAWVDFEHGGPSPYDSTVLESLTRAAEVSNTELLVRLPESDPHLIRKVLDAGVRTILISRIETAAEVRQAAEAANFSYNGEPGDRGIGIGRTTVWGKGLDNNYTSREDESIFLGAMIENQNAVENIEKILSVPELGFVFIGPADLSVSLGHPMDKSNPEVQKAIEHIEKTVIDSPVALGGIRNDPVDAKKAIKTGYRVLRVGSDLSTVRNVISDRVNSIRTSDK